MKKMAQKKMDSKGPFRDSSKNGENSSRKEILLELESMGVETIKFDSLSIEELGILLTNLQNLVKANTPFEERHRGINSNQQIPILSEADKKILKLLLSSDGHVSSLVLSKKLEIPLSTTQRRRKRLEANLIERNYLLKGERFGWRMATLFVSANGNTSSLGKKILETNDTVISVTRTLGENGIDLCIDLIFRTNEDLLLLIDKIKSLDGVRNVIWSESVESMGKNSAYYERIIDP